MGRVGRFKNKLSILLALKDEDLDQHLESAAKVDEIIENEPGLL